MTRLKPLPILAHIIPTTSLLPTPPPPPHPSSPLLPLLLLTLTPPPHLTQSISEITSNAHPAPHLGKAALLVILLLSLLPSSQSPLAFLSLTCLQPGVDPRKKKPPPVNVGYPPPALPGTGVPRVPGRDGFRDTRPDP
ncbi:hypothetical protein EV360DRAFT_90005 [Lentinula raphanica]|nr:hypothetical protein EV360DRAFT_90511 [Lentinula raphanica]KAJ3746886.1 hypothetical protein EV360DRAFT_90005 [Lentinula raphanica]